MRPAASLPCLRTPVNPATRASPFVKRMNPIESRQRLDSLLTSSSSTYRFTALRRVALMLRARVRTDKLQPVIRAARAHRRALAADPDERRARGPHSLAADRMLCRPEFNRHTPRRSKPLFINESRITRWRRWPLRSSSLEAQFGLRRPQAGNLKASPRASMAQAMRAFLAAIATTAFQ